MRTEPSLMAAKMWWSSALKPKISMPVDGSLDTRFAISTAFGPAILCSTVGKCGKSFSDDVASCACC
eukprot:scaffold305752_cov30-Tisochrysis_lutea.AAC.2